VPLVAILALALAVRITVALQLEAHPLLQPTGQLDTAVVVGLARSVARGDLLLRQGTAGQPFFLAPLYPYVLGLLLALTGGSLLAARLAQSALGTLAVFLLHDAARPWVGRGAALTGAALLAVTGPVVFHESLLLQSALDPLLTAAALALVSRALLREGSAGTWVLAGAGLGLLALNRPNALVWALGLAVALLIGPGWRSGARRAGALLGGLALAVAPATARNLVVSGEPVLLASHGGLNLFIGNNPGADGTYRSVPGITPDILGQARDARQVAEGAAGHPLSTREVDAHFRHLALDWARQHPGAAARLFLRKLAYLGAAVEIPLNESYAYFSRDEPTLLRWLVGAGLLMCLGLAGLGDRLLSGPSAADGGPGSSHDRFGLWVLVVPAYAVSVAVFFVSSRYRLPLLVPLAAGAGFALRRITDAIAGRRRRRVVAYALALAPLAVVAWWPHGLDDGRTAAREDMIVWRIESGSVEEALSRLAVLEVDSPQRAPVSLFRAGRALQARGRPADAVPLLERSLALDPGRAEVEYALGQCLLDLHRPADAEPHLRSAFTAGVRPDLSGFDLARALAALGRPHESAAVLEQLLTLDLDAASRRTVARLAVESGDPALALRFLDQAVAAQSDDAASHELRGLTLVTLGRVEEARRALSEAARLEPRRASAHFNLALLEARAGHLDAARDALERALSLRPDYPQARALREQLGAAR